MNLKNKDLEFLRQFDMSLGLTSASVKGRYVGQSIRRKPRDDGVDFLLEVTEDEFATAISFAREDSLNDRVHFAATMSDRFGMIVANDKVVVHLL